jgi:hypothetical protein
VGWLQGEAEICPQARGRPSSPTIFPNLQGYVLADGGDPWPSHVWDWTMNEKSDQEVIRDQLPHSEVGGGAAGTDTKRGLALAKSGTNLGLV